MTKLEAVVQFSGQMASVWLLDCLSFLMLLYLYDLVYEDRSY